uniref:TRP C-terminal domain-containing protein n=1 Tax=Amphimedon queenslandica TaxID=400682 RepID=A0A1X7TQ39_AMPQE
MLLKNENEPNPLSPAIIVSSSSISLKLMLHGIQLLDCPIGFELNATEGKCVCSKALHKLHKSYPSYQPDCQISSESDNSIPTITRINSEWIGTMNQLFNGTAVFGAALNCFEFCRYKSGKTKLVVDHINVTIADSNNLSNSIPLCVENREGPLCSQCITGYSAVFGSSECRQCSNWWLLMLLVYVPAGPLIIYLLYALKLTLTTGTLNGIIFCIQIFGFFNPPSINLKEMNWLVSGWIDTQLSHPLCLYNGMTNLWKQGLSTVYQIYVLSILLGIIFLSKFSVRISNKIANSSVQILVTVVHISFSYLLTSIMDVFTPVTIYTNNTSKEPMQVWFKHPTVEYGTHGHLVLIIITSLVVGPILGVYMTVLLAGRPLMRINYRIREYIRPVYEAIHAPYKRNREFFFVSRLLIVILFYVIYVCFRGKDMFLGMAIASPILFAYIAVESLARPFKRMSLNIFNVFLLSLLALVYGSSWYFMKSDHEYGLIIIRAIYNAAVVASIFGVIVIHFLWVTGLFEKIKIKVRKYWPHLSRQNQEEVARADLSGSFFEPYDRVREPLLSSHSVQYH